MICHLLLFAAAAINAAKDKQPHIVLVLADDLGHSDVTFNNKAILTTPFLDSLSANKFFKRRSAILTSRKLAVKELYLNSNINLLLSQLSLIFDGLMV